MNCINRGLLWSIYFPFIFLEAAVNVIEAYRYRYRYDMCRLGADYQAK